MTDELKQEMTEKFNSAYGEEVKIGLREALRKIYIDGGEHGYQYAIEKIFKCIEDQAIFGWIEDIEVDKFLEKIRKTMQ